MKKLMEAKSSNLVFSNFVTSSKIGEDWIIHNWSNNEGNLISDIDHPLYLYFEGRLSYGELIDKLSLDDYESLVEDRFLVQNKRQELESVLQEIRSNEQNDKLTLIILPVGQACNFNCSYCYESKSKSQFMDNKSATTILTSFIDKQNPARLHIEYFGGEPLLNKEFIINFNSYLTKKYSFNVDKFSSSMTTNGYSLDDKTFKELYDVGVRSFQITIDGLEELHNKTRPLNTGKGTFSTIIKNLKNCSAYPNSYDFTIDIRVNFNDESASENNRVEFIKYLKDNFGTDNRFRFLFRPISDYATNNQTQADSISYCSKTTSNNLKEEYEKLAILSELQIADLSTLLGKGSSACYAGKPNYLIIDRDLSVKKCTVALTNPINNVGYISTEGKFIKNSNWVIWVKNDIELADKCKACHFLRQCTGNACPLINIINKDIICSNIVHSTQHQISMLNNQHQH